MVEPCKIGIGSRSEPAIVPLDDAEMRQVVLALDGIPTSEWLSFFRSPSASSTYPSPQEFDFAGTTVKFAVRKGDYERFITQFNAYCEYANSKHEDYCKEQQKRLEEVQRKNGELNQQIAKEKEELKDILKKQK